LETLFSTEDVHPRERYAYWHDVACKTLVNHESKPHSYQAFHAQIEAGSVADIGLVRFETAALHVHRTQRHIALAASDELFLCRQLAGTLAIEQLTRSVELTPGSMTLLDPLVPYTAQFSPGSKLLVLKLERRDLEARIGKTTQMLARDLNCGQAECSLTSAFIALLPEHAERMSAVAQALVRDQTLDLIATSLGAVANDRVKLASSKLVVLQKVCAAIETNLSNPHLDATAVATAAGVSIRYANAVLAGRGTSITALIRSLRLTRCRVALRDPMQERRKISEIAYGWGFCDMTSFCRAFKAAYGMTPTECRRSRLT
jgi:AraC-like DNA-binding protein